jgi:hypothetical protein
MLEVDRKTLDRMIKRHNIRFGNLSHFPMKRRLSGPAMAAPRYQF